MKKLLLVLVILAVVGGSAFAIDWMSYPPPVEGGNILIDAGLGLRGMGHSSAKWSIPPLFVQVEYALPVGVPISVGGIFSLYQYGWKGTGWEYTWTNMDIAARGNWHFGFDISWLDFYAGLSLGYTVSTLKVKPSSYPTIASYDGFYYAGQVGAHFYFTPNIGAMAEAGYPYWLKVGVAFKF